MTLIEKATCYSCVDEPAQGKLAIFVDSDDCKLKTMDNTWCINTISCWVVPTDTCQLSNSCWYIKWFSPDICCITFSNMWDWCSCTWHVPSWLAVFEWGSSCSWSWTTYSWSFNLWYWSCSVRNWSTVCLSQPTTWTITVSWHMFAVASWTIKIYVLV